MVAHKTSTGCYAHWAKCLTQCSRAQGYPSL
jgi:hypothetical protein